MSLEAQIALITVPQEFSRLCNAVLSAEHGDDFLPIDDDRPDRGNDGYLKSEKRIFAAHCFKRVQNQSIDDAIRSKMLGDLGKAISLKEEEIWEIDAWTFLSNYPVPDAIAERVVKRGEAAGIDVSWRDAPFLAAAVRKHDLGSSFPDLHVTQIESRLDGIKESIDAISPKKEHEDSDSSRKFHAVPRTPDEQRLLLLHRPIGWEHLLYAGVLVQGREALATKWHDEELGMPRGDRLAVDADAAMDYLSSEMSRLRGFTSSTVRVFTDEAQEQAFGAPGEPGDPVRIENLARHVVGIYESTLDWAANLRATVPPEEYQRVYDITASMAHAPIVQFRQFVDDAVREMGRIPEHVARDEKAPLTLNVELVLTLDPDLLTEFEAELRRLRRAVR